MSYVNRIVGHGEEAPDQLAANPRNWRIHPRQQEQVLAGVLEEVGWVAEIVVNQRTGFVIDGHLRVAHAISQREPLVPVTYVDLSEDEEAVILATFDPLSALAATDNDKLDELTRTLHVHNDTLAQFLQVQDAPDFKTLVVPIAHDAHREHICEACGTRWKGH